MIKMIFALIFTILTSSHAFADAVIFSGEDVKSLKPSLDLFGTSKIQGISFAPNIVSTVATASAPLGSIAMNYSSGSAYLKTSSSALGWEPVIVSSNGNALFATRALDNLSNTNVNTPINIKSSGSVRLYDGNSTNYVGFKANSSLSGNTTYNWPSDGTGGYFLQTNGSGDLSWQPTTTSGGGTGTVTEIDFTVPSIISITGNPVKISGTIDLSLKDQVANTFLAGPASGASAIPSFRAIVDNDVPVISLVSGVRDILPIANGGTNNDTFGSGGVVWFDGTSLTTTAGQFYWDNSNKYLSIGGNSPTFDLEISKNKPAANVNILVENTGSGAGADANLRIRTASGGGNPHSIFQIDSLEAWSSGLVQSEGNKWILSASDAINVNNVMIASAAGSLQLPQYGSGVLTTLADGNVVVGKVNLPGDVSGVLGVANGGTGLSSVGSNGQVLVVSNGTLGYGTNVAAALAPSYISIAATSTPATDVGVILANAGAGSFTVRYPSAASVTPGSILVIKKTDRTANVVSGAEGFSHNMWTPNESWTIQSDGSQWTVLSHNTAFTLQPEIVSVSAVTTDPNWGTQGDTVNKQNCNRNGKQLSCRLNVYKPSSGGGNSAGTGLYYVKLPSFISHPQALIDSSYITYASGLSGIPAQTAFATGRECYLSNTSTNDYGATMFPFDGSRFKVSGGPTFNADWGSTTSPLSGALYFQCSYTMPIQGWED